VDVPCCTADKCLLEVFDLLLLDVSNDHLDPEFLCQRQEKFPSGIEHILTR
jgi:hypothetical protein